MVLNNRTNGRVPISESTRDRVVEAATSLGYAPNPVAQMLVQGSQALIGVFTYNQAFPYDTDGFFFPYLAGIQRGASLQDYNVLLFTRHHNHGRSQIFTNSMNSLLLADGSILMGLEPDRAELRRLSEENYPFVYIGRREVPGCEIDWVAHDYQTAAIQAMRHLVGLGHRRIGFVTNGPHYEPQQDKLAGYDQVMIEQPDLEVSSISLADFENAELFIATVQRQGITALMCDDHTIFDQVLVLLYTHGLRVPAEISVLSLTTASHSLPYLLEPTHVQLDQHQAGETAAQILVRRIMREAHGPQQIVLPSRFVPGETTGEVPK